MNDTNPVKNPVDYDDKSPTNVRLDKDLKEKVKDEAQEKGITIADVINDALRRRYRRKG